MIKIKPENCISCGKCVWDCFPRALTMQGDSPFLTDPKSCIQCGHCIAVCPSGAVSDDCLCMDEVKPYNPDDFSIDGGRLLNVIQFRRSIRHFKDQAVEEEKIKAILEGGRYTPTARNAQQTSYLVVREAIADLREMALETLCQMGEELVANGDPGSERRGRKFIRMRQEYLKNPNEADQLFFHAPLLILVLSGKEFVADAAAAASNMELMAVAQGLGVLFSGYFAAAVAKSAEIRSLLDLKSGQRVVRCMVIGYPDINFYRTVPRKPVDVKYI